MQLYLDGGPLSGKTRDFKDIVCKCVVVVLFHLYNLYIFYLKQFMIWDIRISGTPMSNLGKMVLKYRSHFIGQNIR